MVFAALIHQAGKSTPFADENLVTNRKVVGRAWRVLLGLAIGLVALMALNWVFNAVVVGFPENPATVEQVEAELQAALPIGSTKAAVVDWASKRRGVGAVVVNPGSPTFGVTIRDTSRSLVILEDIEIDFTFGTDDRLVDRKVRQFLTGP